MYSRRFGFTLVELLIVVGILAVLGTVVVSALNPVELTSQSRDSGRLSDLSILNNTLYVFSSDRAINGGPVNMGSANTVYISIPDTSSTCSSLSLPALPAGWSYNCVTQANLKNIDGTGWIPVNLTLMSKGSPISVLPVDPTNTVINGLYYVYTSSGTTNQWELTMIPESQKYRSQQAASSGSLLGGVYAFGSNTSISPIFNSSGLVGYWRLDEGAGTTASDSSGNGNVGTLPGGTPPVWSSGQIGQALTFSSAASFVDVPDVPSVSPSRFTVSAWIKPASCPGSWVYIVNKGDYGPGTNDIGFTVRSCKLAGLTGNGVGYTENTGAGSSVSLNVWQHAALVYDGATLKAYLNGAQQWSIVDTRDPTTAGKVLEIANSSGNYFPGSIDDVRMYNRALSPSEVVALYNATR